MSGNGSNSANALPGYRKTLSGGFYGELYDGAPAAPPDAGLPWTLAGYEDNPLSNMPANAPPPQPERHIEDLSRCMACGATFGFNTDAAKCPSCTDAERMTGGLTAPGTPWF